MSYVRKVKRRGETRLVIDIRYRDLDGTKRRFRRDAQVQMRAAAEAEAKRLLVRLAETGTLELTPVGKLVAAPRTVDDAIEHFTLVELPKLKPSTQRSYRVVIESEVRPRFGQRPVSALNKDLFIRLDTELAEAGLSSSTRRNILVVARRILRSIVDAGWLEQVPHLPRLPRVGRKALRVMTWQESEAIIQRATPSFHLAALLARDAGLRASEVRGLRWPDVDLKARVLTVRRAICHGVEAVPKSGHERVVPLTDELFEALTLAEEKKLSPWAPVAPNRLGRVWAESSLRNAFRAACTRAGVSGLRLHDLRHLFVSALFRRGASAPVVQKLAGHEVLVTTQRYAHADDDECRAAIAALGARRSKSS